MTSVFSHQDYISYLIEISDKRGEKSKWAEAIGCQRGYITSILKGAAHLSLEQAEKLSRHLGLSEDEHDYFLLMIEKDRASTPTLKRYFDVKMTDLRERRNLLRNRYKASNALSLEQQATFYSSWHHSAIHMCLFVGLNERDQIARALNLPNSLVSESVEFLLSAGLASETESGQLNGHTPRTFLAGDSPLISKHHTNWRIRAIQSLDGGMPDDLHYSSVFSICAKDFDILRTRILQWIDDFKQTVQNSKEETEVCCLNLDLMRLLR